MSRVIGALCCAFAVLCAPARAAPTPDGTGVRTLLSGQRLSSPGWSPDGNRIAVVDGHRVLVLDAIGGQTRTVLDKTGAAGPTWGPDGTRRAPPAGAQG